MKHRPLPYAHTPISSLHVAGALFGILSVLLSFVGYIRHLVWGISGLDSNSLEGGQIALAILGALVPPIGSIHGVLLLFGIV